jgi:hypothetical protein
MEEKMRAISQSELLRLTRTELLVILRKIASDLRLRRSGGPRRMSESRPSSSGGRAETTYRRRSNLCSSVGSKDMQYAQLFRLRGLTYSADSVKRPQYFGTITNDIVYKRLAPGVLDGLKKVIPKTEAGRRKAALSQALTKNVGYPKLREHLGATVAYITVSKDYLNFMEKRNKYRPRFGEQYVLPFDHEPEQDDAKGL